MNRPRISRRSLLASVGGPLMAVGLAAPAAAQEGRGGQAIVGFPAGGTADIVQRMYGEQLRGWLGRPTIVDNHPGAEGRLALETLKPLPADGCAVVVTPASMLTIYPHLYARTLRYDPMADFAPVSTICIFPFGLAVGARHPARTPQEFIAWAKLHGTVDWARPVPGAMPHFIGTQLARLAGLSLSHTPYRGSAPAAQGLLSGAIQAALLPIGELTAFHRSGDVRLIAVTAPQRLPRLPDVPTFAEAGLGALAFEEGYGADVPACAPEPVVAELKAGIASAARSAPVREGLARLEVTPLVMEPSTSRDRIGRERDEWAPIVATSGFNPDQWFPGPASSRQAWTAGPFGGWTG